ncbi:TF26 [Hepatospora eriocheir]|uniref:TF26 n=1 Tax=Hepatospora eriocheir TaxID=1081669 RepID=A0A1X0QFT5_9MICR|nr:TF26 [Hepatospora eriocheir]
MHSRLVNLHILKNITSDNVAKAIESWLIKYGQPKALLSDQGKQFIGQPILSLCNTYNVKKLFSFIYYPRGNSIAERINRTITDSLCTQKSDFYNTITNIKNAINNSYHSSINCSPNELLYNHSKFDILGLRIPNKTNKQNTNLTPDNFKRRTYSICDKVSIKNTYSHKLSSKYLGPYEIISINTFGNVLTVNAGDKRIVLSVNRVKPFKVEEDVMSQHDKD